MVLHPPSGPYLQRAADNGKVLTFPTMKPESKVAALKIAMFLDISSLVVALFAVVP